MYSSTVPFCFLSLRNKDNRGCLTYKGKRLIEPTALGIWEHLFGFLVEDVRSSEDPGGSVLTKAGMFKTPEAISHADSTLVAR